uniref:Macaca fascicularis brain cDNA clone: QflA-16483, similar to human ring finger protein 31 (RNF31), mRNA, RefSeq: NM_017999.3 n=1 Tax=Macaca fascicularis TaxID=9541 RepID=I7GBD8_MACFA|nr:unnamed protein product [Macaca fascicularis]
MRQQLCCVPYVSDLGWPSLPAWWWIPEMLAFACNPFSRGILCWPLPRVMSGTVFTVPSATRALAGCV